MDYVNALGIKFIFVSVVIFSIFGIFYNVSIGLLFGISLFVTGVAYLIGDLFLLPRYGNVIASIADFGLAFVLLWGIGNLLVNASIPLTTASLAGAFFIGLCEPLFHAYMLERVLGERKNVLTISELQTEFAEEVDAQTMIKKNEQPNKDKK